MYKLVFIDQKFNLQAARLTANKQESINPQVSLKYTRKH